MKKCLFCDIAQDKTPADIFYEDETVVAFEDINPQAPVHTLIIPRKHIATIMELTEADANIIARMILTAKLIAIEKGIDPDGFRLVWNCGAQAGQTVFHVHLHLLGGRGMHWPPG